MPSGPYRGHKGDIWEGGHRVPLIVRWPKRVPAAKSNDQLVSLTDILATTLEVAGVKLPSNGAEDSISFLPALLEKETRGARKTLVNHSNHGEFAYRDGPWKLVFRMRGRNLQQSRGKPAIAELYNLKSDVGERQDVSMKHPQIVKHMTAGLKTLIERGSSRAGQKAQNDAQVRFDAIQKKRWAAAK